MQTTTVWQALASPRFLFTAWPWRSLAYVLTTPITVGLLSVPLMFVSLPWMVSVIFFKEDKLSAAAPFFVIGAVFFAAALPLLGVPFGWLERGRLSLLGVRPPTTTARRAAEPLDLLRNLYVDPASWRASVYAVASVTLVPLVYTGVGIAAMFDFVMIISPVLADGHGPVAFGFGELTSASQAVPYAVAGVVLLPVLPYLWTVLAAAHGTMGRALLGGVDSENLKAELVEVSRSRARLVDAFEAERRRIERDLHDGAQQQLIGLTMQLGLAKMDVDPQSPAGKAVSEAHDQAKDLMEQLRELIRGIHPPVLTDRGLPAAVAELADRTPMPVTVSADLPGRLPGHLEGTAYFVVAEALTNVVKHSAATQAAVTVRLTAGTLEIEVTDNGRGGADARGGTGLTGLADRVAVANGRMFLSSPIGGPTLVRVELPCRR
ncbi:sensor histidine kinase [Fodinicola acaciae]|uniref:sensor histidine kinase n=1 Tax=Fodinicola acaciae TaxID=2681555 RepID=UPI001FE48465|nr:histidine kinase [Fodinicola acaciae]